MTADIFAGQFSSQPLVFAHLWDQADDGFYADRIEVICNQNPTTRLRHYFSEKDAQSIEDALGLHTTCVIVFSTAGLEIGTDGTNMLSFIGTYPVLRIPPS